MARKPHPRLHLKHPRPQRAARRRPAAETVFADGSKLLTDAGGNVIGLVEARTAYVITKSRQVKAITPRQPLTEHDWNFSPDRVPDDELIPCLLWEFLRESPTARALGQDWLEWFTRAKEGHPLSEKDADPKSLWPRTNALSININYPGLFDEFIKDVVFRAWGFMNLADMPWQKLPPDVKRWLNSPFKYVNQPVFIGNGSHANFLARVMRGLREVNVDLEGLAIRTGEGTAKREINSLQKA